MKLLKNIGIGTLLISIGAFAAPEDELTESTTSSPFSPISLSSAWENIPPITTGTQTDPDQRFSDTAGVASSSLNKLSPGLKSLPTTTETQTEPEQPPLPQTISPGSP